MYPLGTGSDYTAFIHGIGIPSTDLRFSGAVTGEYHTIYDTYPYFKKFIDPGFHYTEAMAQVNGRVLMRMASADILPFDFTRLADHITQYNEELKAFTASKCEKVHFQNEMLDKGLYKEVQNPYTQAAQKQPEVPNFDFSSIDHALNGLHKRAEEYDRLVQNLKADKDQKVIDKLNQKLQKVEQNLLAKEGLPGQRYYKNVLYAPGKYTGYGAKTLPGVRQAIELGQYDIVNPQIQVLSGVLKNYNAYLDQLLTIIKQAQ